MKRGLKLGLFLVVLISLWCVANVKATDYYVDKDSIGGQCNNNNPGTINSPWCTLSKASLEVIAGDTVYIRAGTYTTADNGCVLLMRHSGTPGSRITWQNYNNELVIIRGQAIGIKFNNQEHVTVDGLTIDNVNIASSLMAVGASFWSAEHCILQNCTIRYMTPDVGSSGGRAVHLHASSHYNQILGCTIEYAGQTEAQGDDMGECVWIDGTHNLVQGNTIRYGGHNTVLIGGNYNILRDNTMYNTDWGRVMQTASPDETYRQLVEDNIIRDSGDHTDVNIPNPNVQLQASNTIFRRNRVYNGLGTGATASSNGDYETDNVRIFHNVFYNNGLDHDAEFGYALQVNEHTDENMQNLDVRNNICYGNYRLDPVNDVNLRVIWGHHLDPEDVTNVGNHWDDDGDPKFTNPGSGDFTLQSSSPCINTGAWLTVTRSAGSGTSIPVEDASYFMDGWDIIDGDLIQLEGQSVTARITNVNYATNTITVNTPLTWTSGQGVSLSYSGSAPDIGAYEYGGISPPPPTTCTNCKTNPCNTYNDCTSATGTCTSGYCCQGSCTTLPIEYCGDGACNTATENCSSCPQDCGCSSPWTCCGGLCVNPACSQNSDCGIDTSCTIYTCNNPGTCSVSCYSRSITSCIDNDGCCPFDCDQNNDNDCEEAMGFWNFDEEVGSIVTDSSGNGNIGTIYGASWTTGLQGNALKFDGVGNYVDFGNDPSIQSMDDNFSVEIVFKAEKCPPNINSYIFSRSMGYTFRICENGVPNFGYLIINKAYEIDIAYNSGMNLTNNEWYHAVLVFNNKVLNLYLNGQLLNSQEFNDMSNFLSEKTLAGSWTTNYGWFNGTLDQVVIYSNPLSAQEILDHYNDLQNHGGVCSDGNINTGEQCDGSDWGSITGCTNFNFIGGTLSCGADCQFNTSLCTGGTPGVCNDGNINTGEQCDGSDWGSITGCTNFNFTGGILSCGADCQFDTSLCIGNGGRGNGGRGNGGSGTPSPTPPSIQEIHSGLNIIPHVAAIIKDFDSSIGIKKITINVNNPAQNVRITVLKYDSRPANVSVLKTRKVYKYLQIETENLEDKLNNSVITIQIEKNWTFENNVEKENIAMFRFNKSYELWDELTTNYTEEDDIYYYYDIELDSLSYFAIAEKTLKLENRIKEFVKGYWLWMVVALIVIVLVIIVMYKHKKKKTTNITN